MAAFEVITEAVGGGTSITFPDLYSEAALEMLDEIGVRWKRFLRWWGLLPGYLDFRWWGRHGLESEGIFFEDDGTGKALLSSNPLAPAATRWRKEEIEAHVNALPIEAKRKRRFVEPITDEPEILPGLSADEQRQRLSENHV